MRLLVHVQGLDFITVANASARVFELRREIEQQFASLRPREPPLATHALKNRNGYLLPDALRVGDVLADSEQVSAVLERELRPAAEADLGQVLQRWRYFQRYTLATLSATVRRGPSEVMSSGCGEAVPVLVELLGSVDAAVVEQSVELLRLLLCRPSGSPHNLGVCDTPEHAGWQAAKWFVALGLHGRGQATQRSCAAIMCACLEAPGSRAAFAKSGAAAALAHLSRSEDVETRTLATRGLLAMKHDERVASGEVLEPSAARLRAAAARGEAKPEGPPEAALMSLDNALDALERSELVPAVRIALETALRECGSSSVRRLAQGSEGLRLVKGLARATRFQDARLSGLVADILVALSRRRDEAALVYAGGGFELLLSLLEEEEHAAAVDDAAAEQAALRRAKGSRAGSARRQSSAGRRSSSSSNSSNGVDIGGGDDEEELARAGAELCLDLGGDDSDAEVEAAAAAKAPQECKQGEAKTAEGLHPSAAVLGHLELRARFRAVCHNDFVAMPLRLAVGTLVRTSSTAARCELAEMLLSRARSDEANELFTYIAPLLSAAAQASEVCGELLLLAQTLCVLSVKEVNKPKLVKYGAATLFARMLIDSATEQELQRVAAKALANLANSSRPNRAAVIEVLQSRLPPLDSFKDSIVSTYLEMIFTSD
jgi:hypothetical protein